MSFVHLKIYQVHVVLEGLSYKKYILILCITFFSNVNFNF